MKVTYESLTAGKYTIEVPDEWKEVYVELDREEYNVNHKETRRHVSLEALNVDGNLIPSDANVELEIDIAEGQRRLQAAISELEPQQQKLLYRVFFQGEKEIDIATEEGVTKASITRRLSKIYKRLHKILESE